MRLLARRRDAALAEQQLLLARHGWYRQAHALSAGISRLSGVWIIGGGFACGLLAARVPLRGIGRAMRLLVSAASFALRSPLAALVAEAFVHKRPDASVTGTQDSGA
jgi:hypothetical protein